jgi:hypothetical protein
MARRKGPGDPPPSGDDSSEDVDWGADWDPGSDESDDGDDLADASDHAGRTRDTAFCPDCGAEVYDAADVCPKCFTWINGETVRHAPGNRRGSARFTRAVVWMLIAAMLLGAGLLGFVALLPTGR